MPIALLVLLSACGGSNNSSHTNQSGASPHPSVTNSRGVSSDASAALLSESILGGTVQAEQDQWYLGRVQSELVRRCMASHGFRYYEPDFGPLPATDTATADQISPHPADGYGLFAQAETNATNNALGTSVQLPASASAGVFGGPPSDEQDRYVLSLPAAQQKAYSRAFEGSPSDHGSVTLPGVAQIGFATGGCLGAAEKQIYGSLSEQAELQMEPQILHNQISQQVQGNHAYVVAGQQWQVCMRQAGFSYTSPGQAIGKLQQEYAAHGPQPSIHQQEIRIADADAKCDATSRLRAITAQVQDKYLHRMSATVQGEILTLEQFETQAVARAKALLAGNS